MHRVVKGDFLVPLLCFLLGLCLIHGAARQDLRSRGWNLLEYWLGGYACLLRNMSYRTAWFNYLGVRVYLSLSLVVCPGEAYIYLFLTQKKPFHCVEVVNTKNDEKSFEHVHNPWNMFIKEGNLMRPAIFGKCSHLHD